MQKGIHNACTVHGNETLWHLLQVKGMEFRFIILTLQSFSLTTLALVDSMTINNVNGNIGRLVRWDRMALHSTLQEVRFSLWLEDLYTDVNKGGGRESACSISCGG
jgi:hypothetical protein